MLSEMQTVAQFLEASVQRVLTNEIEMHIGNLRDHAGERTDQRGLIFHGIQARDVQQPPRRPLRRTTAMAVHFLVDADRKPRHFEVAFPRKILHIRTADVQPR